MVLLPSSLLMAAHCFSASLLPCMPHDRSMPMHVPLAATTGPRWTFRFFKDKMLVPPSKHMKALEHPARCGKTGFLWCKKPVHDARLYVALVNHDLVGHTLSPLKINPFSRTRGRTPKRCVVNQRFRFCVLQRLCRVKLLPCHHGIIGVAAHLARPVLPMALPEVP